MQCKDIDDLPILEFISLFGRNDKGSPTMDKLPAIIGGGSSDLRCVSRAMPGVTSWKLAHAKMIMLHRRGLIDGCTCGCRGDFELTEKGWQYLSEHCTTTIDDRLAKWYMPPEDPEPRRPLTDNEAALMQLVGQAFADELNTHLIPLDDLFTE